MTRNIKWRISYQSVTESYNKFTVDSKVTSKMMLNIIKKLIIPYDFLVDQLEFILYLLSHKPIVPVYVASILKYGDEFIMLWGQFHIFSSAWIYLMLNLVLARRYMYSWEFCYFTYFVRVLFLTWNLTVLHGQRVIFTLWQKCQTNFAFYKTLSRENFQHDMLS